METLKLLFLVFCLVPSLTHGRHLRKLKKQQQQHQNRQQTIENVQEEEKEAKKISSSLSSLKLNNIPHRIYLAGKSACSPPSTGPIRSISGIILACEIT